MSPAEAVRQTELTVDHRLMFRFHIATKFANDAAVGFWVPAEVLQGRRGEDADQERAQQHGRGGTVGLAAKLRRAYYARNTRRLGS